jgi:hypothetical protein
MIHIGEQNFTVKLWYHKQVVDFDQIALVSIVCRNWRHSSYCLRLKDGSRLRIPAELVGSEDLLAAINLRYPHLVDGNNIAVFRGKAIALRNCIGRLQAKIKNWRRLIYMFLLLPLLVTALPTIGWFYSFGFGLWQMEFPLAFFCLVTTINALVGVTVWAVSEMYLLAKDDQTDESMVKNIVNMATWAHLIFAILFISISIVWLHYLYSHNL